MKIINGQNAEASQDEEDMIDTPYLKFEANFIKKLILP